MRQVYAKAPYGDQREAARFALYGPDSALTSLDTAAALAAVPVRARRSAPRHHGQAHHSGHHHALKDYAGHHGSSHHSQPLHRELAEIAVASLRRYEYGAGMPFAFQALDRWGNASSATDPITPNEGQTFVNSAPLQIATSVLSEAGGVITIAFTDEVEL